MIKEETDKVSHAKGLLNKLTEAIKTTPDIIALRKRVEDKIRSIKFLSFLFVLFFTVSTLLAIYSGTRR